ncbi:ankyrin repeat-containing domain protein [Pseudomassariella vexata]|uniref:Ankyrin repeat-containing domain protein n=1 Tax=Pseudomassariella vexata TaxID=1141098 RepID=A0A1Y2DJK3_9PEZI|nr:ankyrin repeat-containing domain protein [Pseudomassariella vexata]ORY59324.1 ankyrin repeat-containing domain protein [Pseudomassariella vexata]
MPSFRHLPVELLLLVSEDLDIRDLSSLSRSCQYARNGIISSLCRRVKDDPAVLCWAVDEGQIGTVERLLVAGADPNVAWIQNESRTHTLKRLKAQYDFYRSMGLNTPQVHHTVRQQYGYDGDEVHDVGQNAVDSYGSRDENAAKDQDDGDVKLNNQESTETDDDGSYDGSGDGSEERSDESDGEDNTVINSPSWPTSSAGLYPNLCFWTPLHIAVRWGRDDIVSMLLAYGANMHALSRGFCECSYPGDHTFAVAEEDNEPLWMPLHTAICCGHGSTAQLLLSCGASTVVTTKFIGSNEDRTTALHTACFSDMRSISRFIVDQGYQTDLDVKDHRGRTPLTYAYYTGSWESIDLLVEMGAELNSHLGPLTLLNHACLERRFAEALRFNELGASINTETQYGGLTTLHCCCTRQYMNTKLPHNFHTRYMSQVQVHLRTRVAQTVIKAGVDVNARAEHQDTPLLNAAFHINLNLSKSFLIQERILMSGTQLVIPHWQWHVRPSRTARCYKLSRRCSITCGRTRRICLIASNCSPRIDMLGQKVVPSCVSSMEGIPF